MTPPYLPRYYAKIDGLEKRMDKIHFTVIIISVKARIRLIRSFDQVPTHQGWPGLVPHCAPSSFLRSFRSRFHRFRLMALLPRNASSVRARLDIRRQYYLYVFPRCSAHSPHQHGGDYGKIFHHPLAFHVGFGAMRHPISLLRHRDHQRYSLLHNAG